MICKGKDYRLRIIILIVMVFIGIQNSFGIVIVHGHSMVPTLKNGDVVIIRKSYLEPKIGDIVLIRTSLPNAPYLIKRIIAIEGQQVSIDYDTNKIEIDGIPLDEQYINLDSLDPLEACNGREYEVYTIPSGYVFVLGDNRNYSIDSRMPYISYIPLDSIIGRLIV